MPPCGQPRHDTAMPIDDLKIYRFAHVMQTRWGDNAMAACRARMAKLEQAGKPADVATWRRIITALEVLERKTPGEGERQH